MDVIEVQAAGANFRVRTISWVEHYSIGRPTVFRPPISAHPGLRASQAMADLKLLEPLAKGVQSTSAACTSPSSEN
jgi:hypothetical protein